MHFAVNVDFFIKYIKRKNIASNFYHIEKKKKKPNDVTYEDVRKLN